MLVDADGSPAWRGRRLRRAAVLESAARVAVGFKTRAVGRRFQDRRLASPVDVVVEERFVGVVSFFSSRYIRRVQRAGLTALPARCPRSALKSLQRITGVSSLSPSSSLVSALDA